MRLPGRKLSISSTLAASRRAAIFGAALLVSPTWPALADLAGDTTEQLAKEYAAGARASGGRGANALIKKRAESGVQRIGGDPLFKAGQILDTVRSNDGSAVDISFAFPPEWSLSKGPNLDVRDVRTSDSAFLLVADLPNGKSIDKLPRAFYTDLIFAPEGKYGAYGGVDDFSISKATWALISSTSPSGGAEQVYRQFDLSFNALTYNANTVNRRAKVTATALGGSVFVLVTSCLGSRYDKASGELESIQRTFRAYATSKARAAEVEAQAAAAAAAASSDGGVDEFEKDDMAKSRSLDGTVGATTVGRIGFRYD